jgi:cardiolipin synthase
VPFWLTALVIARDLAIVIGVGIAWLFSLPLKIEPLYIGKVSTVIQVGYIGLILLLLALDADQPGLVMAGTIIAASVTAASWLVYGQLLVRALAVGRRPA